MLKKTILCYGDSNTWGYRPSTGERFDPNVRWPGVLQALLGDGCTVLEAALSGRTTTWDDPWDECLNGRSTLVPVLRMAAPLDLVILMLGTNDLKSHTAWESAMSCDTLITMIQQNAALFRGGKPNVLWVAPPLVAKGYSVLVNDPDGACMSEQSEKFGAYYKQFASFLQVPFFDAATVAQVDCGPNADGVHLGEEGHKNLGTALAAQVCNIL